MNIKLNNRLEFFDKNTLTISEILKLKNFTFKMLVVKINGNLIKKSQYQEAKVKDGDEVHILHMISGG